ncbi:MAG TPA: alpha/beta fold hydrolase [Nostocaceae cyanobacterium]|nr:alpha/beta fold hydrolase [Nostocaceae cyanobacterium]
MRNKLKIQVNFKKLATYGLTVITLTYFSTCLLLYFKQKDIIFRPKKEFLTLPSSPEFQLPYTEEKISISNPNNEYIHAWWVPAPSPQEKITKIIPNEPVKILKSPKVILYLCGAGGNKGYYNHVARLQAFRQLGFSTLVIDYRGFGGSKGNVPSEEQLYTDSEIAWNYLVKNRRIPPKQIVIYGESLGGAVALNLAIKHPEAKAIIMQSSFTSMAETIKNRDLYWLFPIDLILTQKFNSISKIRDLKIPVLLIHGTADPIVSSYMSQKLYDTAPQPKQLLLIPNQGHYNIYQPGNKSYLQAIHKFINKLE